MTGSYFKLVMGSCFGAFIFRVNRIWIVIDDKIVDSVLDIEALIFLTGKESLVNRLIFSEQHRHIPLTIKAEIT